MIILISAVLFRAWNRCKQYPERGFSDALDHVVRSILRVLKWALLIVMIVVAVGFTNKQIQDNKDNARTKRVNACLSSHTFTVPAWNPLNQPQQEVSDEWTAACNALR